MDVVRGIIIGRIGDRKSNHRDLPLSGTDYIFYVVRKCLARGLFENLVCYRRLHQPAFRIRYCAVRSVAVKTLRIVNKGQSKGMRAIFNRKIMPTIRHAVIIVTGAAGSTVGHQAPVAGLGRVRIVLVVAGLAVPDVLRPDQVGPFM